MPLGFLAPFAFARTVRSMAPLTRTLQRLSLASVIILSTLLVLSLPAASAPVLAGSATGTPAGDGIGYNNVIGTTGVFSHLMTIGAKKVYVYCLVQSLPYGSSGTYYAVSAPAAPMTNLSHALYIAADSSQLGTPLSVVNEEAVAVQLAIWNETSGFNFYQVNNSTIDARAAQLVSLASGGTLAPGLLGAVFSAHSSSRLGAVTVTFSLRSPNHIPLTGEPITVYSPTPHRYTTNHLGQVVLTLRRRAHLRASFTATLPAGTIMQTGPAYQPLVTTSPAPIIRSLSLSVAPQSVPTTVHHATPTTTPTRVPPVVTPTTVSPPTTIHHAAVTTTTHPIQPPTTVAIGRTPTTLAPTRQFSTRHSSRSYLWVLIVIALIVLALILRPRKRRLK